jgi:methionyl aminopeptidase
MTLKSGLTIAVEPMATLGSKAVILSHDGWTFKTDDGSLSAHFEHTILVTPEGHEVLTHA